MKSTPLTGYLPNATHSSMLRRQERRMQVNLLLSRNLQSETTTIQTKKRSRTVSAITEIQPRREELRGGNAYFQDGREGFSTGKT